MLKITACCLPLATHYQLGQSLFEVVVALGMASLITISLVVVSTDAVRNSTYAKNKTQASALSQAATEWLRGERDRGWDTFITNISLCSTDSYRHCLADVPLTPSSWNSCGTCAEGEVVSGTLRREVTFDCKRVSLSSGNFTSSPSSCSAANAVDANIVIYWTDGSGYHEVRSATDFTDWRQRL